MYKKSNIIFIAQKLIFFNSLFSFFKTYTSMVGLKPNLI